MNDLGELMNGISTLWVLLATVIVNQLISVVRSCMSRKSIRKNIVAIKNEVTHNGGDSNTLSDKLDRVAVEIVETKTLVKHIHSKL